MNGQIETDWVTVPEAASLLGINKAAVYRWITEGRVKAAPRAKIGRGVKLLQLKRSALDRIELPPDAGTTKKRSRA